MCGYQIELRRIREEIKQALETAEKRHELSVATKGEALVVDAVQLGYVGALRHALKIIDEPREPLA